ncbi:MAG TPA: secretin N-terminal domain-containing protein [Verrucomicrobiae bacterium]|nr:secretin N-terminal domain-containing protein [Verrucomicrobiae bacterium]
MKTPILILFLAAATAMAQTSSAPRIRTLPVRPRPMDTNALPAPRASAVSPLSPQPAAPAPTTPPFTIPPSARAPIANNARPAMPSPAAQNQSQADEETIPPGTINFQGVDVDQVLEVYAQLVNRTLLRAGLPSAKIVLKTQTPLTKSEAIEALQAVLALNGISVVNIGDKFVKVMPSGDAPGAGAPINDAPANQLPDLGSYVTHIVQLKYVKPSDMQQVIQPFAKLPNSIIPLNDNGILILRDYAENVKRMLEMIEKVDVGGSASEYISEVIPIKYALAEDIANALNSLGGTGGQTVSIGSSSPASPISGVSGSSTGQRPGGGIGGSSPFGGTGGFNNNGFNSPNSSFGPRAVNSGPAAGSTFQQRLQNIITRASSNGNNQQEQIQVFGQTKIIADQRSNSLLIFATRQDMQTIKKIISELDTLLPQVLIEAVVVDVSLNKGWTFGVSAAQNPKTFSPSVPIVGAGGMNNGQTFLNFLTQATTNGLLSLGTNTFGNALPGGFSYFGNIGPSWDVALQAIGSDSSASIIQRPRIQTSQARPAQFFVGNTVPYVTSTYYGGTTGNSSSYSQLSVGVELDVTPYINPEGLVVMDVNQEIDDLNGSTAIQGVGDVPNTIKRTLSSEVAVKDKDTIILGGFIRSDNSKTRSGVPLLMDIPIIGNLFQTRNSNKDRTELIVMLRPTVLKTPEIAAQQAVKEEKRLPGVSAADHDNAEEERRLMQREQDAERKEAEAERKAQIKRAKKLGLPIPPVEIPADHPLIDTNSILSPTE